ncbi:MAG: HAD-IA family hydrolase [Lachnospiraceae bacterium]|nr:HAD-IA family hydrolase [Lachnospiraceae bacterium]
MRAVIFDMFETLITLYGSPIYFGAQIAEDVGIPVKHFLSLWQPTEYDRSVGNLIFEEAMEIILRDYHCYSEELIEHVKQKRIDTKREAFCLLHSEIIPMLTNLKKKNILIGLISNTFSEEEIVIRESILFPYFDAVFLSSEQGVCKPDEEIFYRCLKTLSVKPEECLYVGDGGSYELEAAQQLGMKAVQAAWYLKEGTLQPTGRKKNFIQVERPLDVLQYL